MRLVISCIGFHDTGSSAVDDYIKEYRGCISTQFEKECRFLQDPDGISDLQYNLVDNWNRLNSNFAVKRFYLYARRYRRLYTSIFGREWMILVNEYLDSLIKFKFEGFTHNDLRIVSSIKLILYYMKRTVELLFLKRATIGRGKNRWNYLLGEKSIHSYISKEEFLQKTRVFTGKLSECVANSREGFLLWEQLIPTTNMNRYFPYFDNLKVIVVDRDPRDVYINHRRDKDSVLPLDIAKFCTVFRDNRAQIQKEISNVPKRILYVHFEDLIYCYKDTTRKIEEFLGFSEEQHKNAGMYFKPELSIKNTQQWNQYKEYKTDCKRIEELLPEFLYDFPKSI